MARGLRKHQARKAAVAALGKSLARRASNRCELCRASTALRVIEIPPIDLEEPLPERAALVCGRCAALVEGGKLGNPDELRFLEEAIWAAVVPVQLAAVRVLHRLAEDGVDWAITANDSLYLDPELQEIV